MICWRCGTKNHDNSVRTFLCGRCQKDAENLSDLYDEVQECTACPLHETAKNKVVGKGFWAGPILFIGEAPGRKEDEEGYPFVGAAGKILDTLIDYIKLKPDTYFITNVVRCRPLDNRVPTIEERLACRPFLQRTIEYVKPGIIVTLGLTATQSITELYKRNIAEKSMGDLHGKLIYVNDLTILPTYHPAAIIYNGLLIDAVKEDFKLLRRLFDGLRVDRGIR